MARSVRMVPGHGRDLLWGLQCKLERARIDRITTVSLSSPEARMTHHSTTTPRTKRRQPLSPRPDPRRRDRAWPTARGSRAVTMRRLGQHLGVEAMSLYKHIADKDDVLTGIADRVAAGVLPADRRRPTGGRPSATARWRPTRSCFATRGPGRSSSRSWSRVRPGWRTSMPSSACCTAPVSRCRTSPTRSGPWTAISTGSRCRSRSWPFDVDDYA